MILKTYISPAAHLAEAAQASGEESLHWQLYTVAVCENYEAAGSCLG